MAANFVQFPKNRRATIPTGFTKGIDKEQVVSWRSDIGFYVTSNLTLTSHLGEQILTTPDRRTTTLSLENVGVCAKAHLRVDLPRIEGKIY